MYNWSIDTKNLKKYPKKYIVWRLEQLINFGLGKEKIDKKELKKHFTELEIDPIKRRYLRSILS